MTLGKFVRMGAAAGALVFAAQANAADLNGGGYKDGPRAFAAPMWSGVYVGINGGYGWRDKSDQFGYAACGNGDCGGPYPAYGGIGADGGFGGGQLGYNWQGVLGTPWLVAGIEADIQGAGISGSGTALGSTPSPWSESYKANLDWFGTIRGRLGYAASNTLIYFTGGFAFGGLRQHAEDSNYTPNAVYEFNDTVTGYVLGGGVEYKFSPSWSLKAEYQYLNFGKNNASLVPNNSYEPTPPASVSATDYHLSDDAFHTVRVGLNYWAHPTYMPLK